MSVSHLDQGICQRSLTHDCRDCDCHPELCVPLHGHDHDRDRDRIHSCVSDWISESARMILSIDCGRNSNQMIGPDGHGYNYYCNREGKTLSDYCLGLALDRDLSHDCSMIHPEMTVHP